jgi:hypothetical protein
MATVPGFDVETLNMLGKLIGGLERFNLEGSSPQEFDLEDLFDQEGQGFYRIRGLSDFWNRQSGVDFWQHMVDLVIGAHSQHQADLTLVMLGTPQKLTVFLSLGVQKATQTILEGIFPGILLEPISADELAYRLRPHFVATGVMTGIPSRKAFSVSEGQQHSKKQQQDQGQPVTAASSAGQQELSQLERVARGMHGATWAYVVQAHPRPRYKVVEDRMKAIDLLTQITTRSQVQWQSTKQDSLQMTTIESGSKTETYSGNMVNYRAQYLTRLLERELERLDQGAAAGQWTTRIYFGASTFEDAQRLAALLLGTLAGPESRPEPLRAALCQPDGKPLEAFRTFLTSSEVASLIQLPREEVPGYAIHDYVRFDVDFHATDDLDLPLGTIQQNGRDTCDTFNISLDALTKHAVVIGVTGSGKTTTVMNLLDSVVEAGKPFLVIEPAKTEYRSLRSALASRAELRVYTLGNEMIAPFRLNPFEFEVSDEPGEASLLTHIDFLKAVFNAAFVLYAPMPQVLEEALHEVYEDKGWDLTSGINRRVSNWKERDKYPIFPTLTDLYYKVEAVTNRLGYDQEVESNIKAGLKTRIGSLRVGSKGLMLDTARGIPLRTLLSTPTILELESIGSDDEKTFLMGLFLARLYEYRRLQAATGNLPQGLQHLLVFEEAHRLLKNTSTQVDTEGANPRAQAIEVFTNMLSEVRAYGQGVLVAEQIPSKLAPDVLKNTNLKIAHRLIAMDDRQSIGQTMNLSEEQQMHLGILTPGMAAVFAEGADHAYLVRLENYKRKISPLLEAELKRISRAYASVKPFHALLDIGNYDVPYAPTGGPDPMFYQAAGKMLALEASKWLWANILLRLISSPTTVFNMIPYLSKEIETEMSYLSLDQHNALMRMVIVRGCSETLQARGAEFGWTYAQVEELRAPLTHGLLLMAQSYNMMRSEANIRAYKMKELEQRLQEQADQAAVYLEQFVNGYEIVMKRGQGPFAGCVHCPAKCLYRVDVRTLLSEKDRKWLQDEFANDSYATLAQRYSAVAGAASHIVQNWHDEEPDSESSERAAEVSYCAILHTIAKEGFSEYEQTMISDSIKDLVFELNKENV